MPNDKTTELINLYFDNRLTKAEEAILFSHLSENEEARNVFKEHFVLKEIIKRQVEEFPAELDNEILTKVLEKEEESLTKSYAQQKFKNAFIYAAAAILIALSFLFFSISDNYKKQFEMTSRKIEAQNRMIELLLNSIPSATVKSNLQNEIIIEPTI